MVEFQVRHVLVKSNEEFQLKVCLNVYLSKLYILFEFLLVMLTVDRTDLGTPSKPTSIVQHTYCHLYFLVSRP